MPVQHQGQQFHTADDVRAHVAEHGLAQPLSLALRHQILREGADLPRVQGNIGIVLPPHLGDGDPDLASWDDGQPIFRDEAGAVLLREGHEVVVHEAGGPRCAHCGVRVAADQHLKLHAPAGFEHTDLRLLVRHCDGCLGTDHCKVQATTPGSGLPAGHPGGFCEEPAIDAEYRQLDQPALPSGGTR